MAGGMKQFSGEEPGSTKGIGVSCRSVVAGYLGSTVLRIISFRIDEPAVYVVLGPNGAGKTTLFRTLSGILRRIRGKCTSAGSPSTVKDPETICTISRTWTASRMICKCARHWNTMLE
jgi:ABC-type branched-subunit amino acid transport system ATPase component